LLVTDSDEPVVRLVDRSHLAGARRCLLHAWRGTDRLGHHAIPIFARLDEHVPAAMGAEGDKADKERALKNGWHGQANL